MEKYEQLNNQYEDLRKKIISRYNLLLSFLSYEMKEFGLVLNTAIITSINREGVWSTDDFTTLLNPNVFSIEDLLLIIEKLELMVESRKLLFERNDLIAIANIARNSDKDIEEIIKEYEI